MAIVCSRAELWLVLREQRGDSNTKLLCTKWRAHLCGSCPEMPPLASFVSNEAKCHGLHGGVAQRLSGSVHRSWRVRQARDQTDFLRRSFCFWLCLPRE